MCTEIHCRGIPKNKNTRFLSENRSGEKIFATADKKGKNTDELQRQPLRLEKSRKKFLFTLRKNPGMLSVRGEQSRLTLQHLKVFFKKNSQLPEGII